MKIKTETKRRIYIFLSMILGILLGVIAYALTETAHINNLISKDLISSEEELFLPPAFVFVFLIAGIILGYALGVRWWQIVYVEKRHWRFRK